MNPRRPRRAGKDERHHRDSEKRRPRKLLDKTSNRNPNNANHGETREKEISAMPCNESRRTPTGDPSNRIPARSPRRGEQRGRWGKKLKRAVQIARFGIIALGRVGGYFNRERRKRKGRRDGKGEKMVSDGRAVSSTRFQSSARPPKWNWGQIRN